MFYPTRNPAVFIAAACLMGILCLSSPAAAEPAHAPGTGAEMQALMNSPVMQKAITAARNGDSRNATTYFREAAQQGNLLAQASISRLYFEGRGVPRDYVESLKWAKLVLVKKQEPTYSMALATIHDIIDSVKRSPDEKDRMVGLTAALLPLVSMLPPGTRLDGHAFDGASDAVGEYFGRKAFNEMTDHEFENPITNPAD